MYISNRNQLILRRRIDFRLEHYFVAVLSTSTALLLTRSLWHYLQPALYPFFLAAVVISCWYGSFGSGLLAMGLGILLSDYFLLPAVYGATVSPANLFRQLCFIGVALLICSLITGLRAAQRQSETQARTLKQYQDLLLHNQEMLQQSEERYRLLVEGVVDYAILMLNPDGEIVSWNIGAERILGYAEEEIIGQPISQLFTSEAVENGQPEQILQQAIAEGRSTENRWYVRKDGTQVWAHCVVTPLWGEAGSLRGFSEIMQDITA